MRATVPVPNRKLRWRRIFVITALAVQVIVYAFLWVQMISDNALRTGTDFIALYTAGYLARTEGIHRAYDVERQRVVQEQQVGFELTQQRVLLYLHPPFTLPLLDLFSEESYPRAFTCWAVAMIAVYIVAIALLTRSLKWEPRPTLLAGAGAMLFFPVFNSLLIGQDTAFAVLGMAIFFYGLTNRRDVLAGFGLSLLIIRPHLAIALALPFLFRRRKVLGGFVAGASGLAVFSVALLGASGTLDYIHVLQISAGGEWHGMNEAAMFNFLGILVRLFPAQSATMRIIAWGVYLGAVAALSLWWQRSQAITRRQAGIAVIAALFVAPHLHFHDLALLLVPLFALASLLCDRFTWREQDAALLPLAFSLILLAGFTPALRYIVPYLVMFGLAFWLAFPEQALRWKAAASPPGK